MANVVLHGAVGGLSSAASGGNFGAGALAGGFGDLAGGFADHDDLLVGTAEAAAGGGVGSLLGGGKFENGAITGAFGYLFNELAHCGGGCGDRDRGYVSALSIDDYLAEKGSPLWGGGEYFMTAGEYFDLDPRLLVALDGVETGFGTNVTSGANNFSNVLYHGSNSPFDSFWSNTLSTANSLMHGYDLSTDATMYSKYCTSNCSLGTLNSFVVEQGGNTKYLHYPQYH